MKDYKFVTKVLERVPDYWDDNWNVLDMADVMPQFAEGNEAMVDYIKEKVRIYLEKNPNTETGRVVVAFVVTEIGELKDVKILRGVSPELDKESINIVKEMPNFIPAQHYGINVSVHFRLPIIFK